jgi:hypothetical protein
MIVVKPGHVIVFPPEDKDNQGEPKFPHHGHEHGSIPPNKQDAVMFIIDVSELHFFIDSGDNLYYVARLPALFDALPQLGESLVVGPDVEGVGGPGSPTRAAEHAQFCIRVIFFVALFIEGIGETRRKDTVPEITPGQQITHYSVAIQLIKPHSPKQFQLETLDFIDAFLWRLVRHLRTSPYFHFPGNAVYSSRSK